MNDQALPATANEMTGAITVEAGLSLPEIWQTLHANAREWREMPRNSKFFELREMLDESDRQALQMLREVPAVQWEQICNGAGWTAIGAVALSWCVDRPDFDRIADRWSLSGTAVSTEEVCLRTAQHMFVGCRPRAMSLSELIQVLEGDVAKLSLALAAWPQDFRNDLEHNVIETAPDQIRMLLKEAARG